jgi:hypothetical protein
VTEYPGQPASRRERCRASGTGGRIWHVTILVREPAAQGTKYYPGAAAIDLVAAGYYATMYVNGVTLDVIAGLADNANPPQPFGLWEMGSSANGTSLTQTQVENYFGYIQSFMADRLQAGKANADIVWFNGNGVNTIRSSSDYRVPLWDNLVNATS